MSRAECGNEKSYIPEILNFKHLHSYVQKNLTSGQWCGARADRSRGFLAGADLKFDLEPVPIFWVGWLLFWGKWKTKDL